MKSVSLRAVLLATVLASDLGAGVVAASAQGWNPFPDREPQEAQRGWSPSPSGAPPERGRIESQQQTPYREQSGDEPGAAGGESGSIRGRPPGYLGELRSGGGASAGPRAGAPEMPSPGDSSAFGPTPRGHIDSGSIIPDRQTPPARTYGAHSRDLPSTQQGARQGVPQASPRGDIPGGYRPYYASPPGERGGAGHGAPPSASPRDGARPGTSVGEGFGERGREVEAQDLAPMMNADGSRLPNELWRGLSVPEIEQAMNGLSLPPRSAGLHDLWRRLLIAKGASPAGGKTPTHFLALRLAALYKSGLLPDLESATAAPPPTSSGDGVPPDGDLVLAVQRAKAQLGLGQREAACASARSAPYQGEVPRPVALDALLLAAYCAAAEGNPAAASMTVDMAREQGMEAPLSFAIVDHMASGGATAPIKPTLPKDVSLIDYRFLQLVKADGGLRLLERAEPALVAALAREASGDARTRIEAAEDAARIHALDAEALAKVYLETPLPPAGADPLATGPKSEPPLRRAALAQAVAAERNPVRKAKLMQSLLQEARSHALYVPVARSLLAGVRSLEQRPEVAFFAETAVEISLAAADYSSAVSWAVFGTAADRSGRPDGLMHWMTLIDIAGAREYVPRGSGLKLTEELAVRGKLAPELLHRLVTVLDALEYNVPIPLWDAASRTPQPAKGHLPETGVLPQLGTASADKKFALTVLLAIRALGADGPEGAHMLALGDTIRALKGAGLEADARRLGFEALFAAWPRNAGG